MVAEAVVFSFLHVADWGQKTSLYALSSTPGSVLQYQQICLKVELAFEQPGLVSTLHALKIDWDLRFGDC